MTDVQGRITERWRYPSGAVSGTHDVTQYGYDDKGRLASITDPGSAVWSYEYDLLERMTKSTDPDTGATTLAYDRKDRQTRSTNAAGQSMWTTYDALDRVTSTRDVSSTGPLRTSFAYDTLAKGYPTSSSRWVGAEKYKIAARGYDDGYRATGATYTSRHRREPPGLIRLRQGVQHQRQPAARVRTRCGRPGFRDRGLPVHARTEPGQGHRHGQLPQRRRLRPVRGSGAPRPWQRRQDDLRGYTYDDTTRRLTTATLDRDIAPNRLDARAYTYDNSGNVTSLSSATAAGTDLQCYRYDGLARLDETWTATANCTTDPSVGTGGSVGGPKPFWHTYTYDVRGNRDVEVKHGTSVGAVDTTRNHSYPASATAQPHTVRGVARSNRGHDGQQRDVRLRHGRSNDLTNQVRCDHDHDVGRRRTLGHQHGRGPNHELRLRRSRATTHQTGTRNRNPLHGQHRAHDEHLDQCGHRNANPQLRWCRGGP